MAPRSPVTSFGAILALGAVLLPNAAAQAVGQRAISGWVVRADSGDRDSSARVFLDTGQETTTDTDGRFSFGAVGPGLHRIAAVGRGCFVAVGEVTVEADTDAVVELQLTAPRGAPMLSTPMQWGDLSRAMGSPSKVITGEDIRSEGAADLLQVLQNAVPQMIGLRGGVSGRGTLQSMRGNNSTLGPSLPVVIIDGIRVVEQPDLVLANIDPGSVARIEIFRGPAGAWVYGHGSAAGVVRVFSKGLEFSIDPTMPPERCGNPLSSGWAW